MAVTNWVKSTHIGHYERIPQCPDLLRKWWKHVVELPYLPIQTEVNDKELSIPNVNINAAAVVEEDRSFKFYFSGRLFLWGPERVCSVRCAIARLSTRMDTLIMNITEEQSYGPAVSEPSKYLYKSVFCLITKSDSYSSSFFYDAIQAECIPIVISDWFIFSFPWFIEYSDFVIRVNEADFLKDANGVLEAIKELYPSSKLKIMRERIRYWKPYLSFEYSDLLIDGNQINRRAGIFPFELLLREIKYSQNPGLIVKDVPCYSPYTCTPRVEALQLDKYLKETRSHLCQHTSRLIGHYKIVYFMQCTRILWPIKLGSFKPLDLAPTGLPKADQEFVLRFHNVSGARPPGWTYTYYPEISDNIISKIKTLPTY
jgi:hypothetical protein